MKIGRIKENRETHRVPIYMCVCLVRKFKIHSLHKWSEKDGRILISEKQYIGSPEGH